MSSPPHDTLWARLGTSLARFVGLSDLAPRCVEDVSHRHPFMTSIAGPAIGSACRCFGAMAAAAALMGIATAMVPQAVWSPMHLSVRASLASFVLTLPLAGLGVMGAAGIRFAERLRNSGNVDELLPCPWTAAGLLRLLFESALGPLLSWLLVGEFAFASALSLSLCRSPLDSSFDLRVALGSLLFLLPWALMVIQLSGSAYIQAAVGQCQPRGRSPLRRHLLRRWLRIAIGMCILYSAVWAKGKAAIVMLPDVAAWGTSSLGILGVGVFAPVIFALAARANDSGWFGMLQLPIPAWFGIVEEGTTIPEEDSPPAPDDGAAKRLR